jgi:hypothetical protein
MAVFLLTFRHTFTADSIQYAMRPAFLIFLSGLVVCCFACRQTNEGNTSPHVPSFRVSTAVLQRDLYRFNKISGF